MLACAPAKAQSAQSYTYDSSNTLTQTVQAGGNFAAPELSGTSNATIAPQGIDATAVTGIDTAGSVRVNNLSNMEALLNIVANSLEVVGIAWGGPTMIFGFMHMAAGTKDAKLRVMKGGAGVVGGLAVPALTNWFVASSADAGFFS